MEKISRVLPSSHRYHVPVKEWAPAARPGAINLGYQPGLTTTHDRISWSDESALMRQGIFGSRTQDFGLIEMGDINLANQI